MADSAPVALDDSAAAAAEGGDEFGADPATDAGFELEASCSGGIPASRSAAVGIFADVSTQCAQPKNTRFTTINARNTFRTR